MMRTGNRVNIRFKDFGDSKSFSSSEIKKWFPNKFDNRYPQKYINKWIGINRKYLELLAITYSMDDEGNLKLVPGNRIGLIPIKTPYGNGTYGSLSVRPRIGLINIFSLLNGIRWRVHPYVVKSEEPLFSSDCLPSWYIASETLKAIIGAVSLGLKANSYSKEISKIPRGTIDWNHYAKNEYPTAKLNFIPCTTAYKSFDIQIHRLFLGIANKIAQFIDGPEVPRHIKLDCGQSILKIKKQLESINPKTPSIELLKKCSFPQYFRAKYDYARSLCIKYLEHHKFGTDISENFGLPWALDMESLFENWVEFWLCNFSKQIGMRFYSAIRSNSRIRFLPLGNWKSMKSLIPDIIMEKDDITLVVDVKYKLHLLAMHGGHPSERTLDEHRRDLHQILSYLNASRSRQKIAVLLYPRLKNEEIYEVSKIINYSNSPLNIKVILADVLLDPLELRLLFQKIWRECLKND